MVQLFHHIVAKLLYLCRRTQKDIQTAMAFLCTRVKRPNEDNYKKTDKIDTILKRHKTYNPNH